MSNLPNQAVANSPPVKPIDTVRAALEKMKSQFQMVLPKHITAERLFRVAMTAIQQTPKLLECDRQSLYSAVMRSAQLGLEPDGILGQAYLIPFKGKVQFIAGYKGLIDLARRSGEVSNIIAKEVCENDEFEVDFSKEIPFVHKPELYGDRGEVTHFWAMARFKDGSFHWDYMTKDEVIAIRDGSSGWKSAMQYAKRDEEGNVAEINSPWAQHFNEMGKKTVIRRIAKFLPMSVQRAAAFDELADAGKPVAINDYGEVVIDDTVIENEPGEATKGKSKLDEFAGAPKRGPRKRAEAKTQAASETETVAAPSVEDYLEDIANAPTAEGLDFKFAEASLHYNEDAAAMAQLTLAKTERKKALEVPQGEVVPPQPGSGKKLFAHPEKTEGVAA
jgi:recombination protein RecT